MRLKIALACVLLIALTIGGYYLIPEVRRRQKEDDAREKLAFVSLTSRLPKGKPIAPIKGLDAESKKRWTALDADIANRQNHREMMLKMLHEKTRRFFLESPGAGSGRGIITDEDFLLDNFYQNPNQSNQSGEPADFPVSLGSPLNRVEPVDEFYTHHKNGLLYFLSPWAFGYVKDRDHVSGFQSHGFRTNIWDRAEAGQRWQVKHVQLVGILSHQKPVVYLTDKLPSMDQVRAGKVRALDLFEDAGMPSLQQGEDLYVIRENDTIRMLGAIRATKTCQKCHDAEIGDLLGAFSYTLSLSKAKEKGER